MATKTGNRTLESEPLVGLVRELSDAFDFFDLNRDGKLSVEEIATVVRSFGEEVTQEDIQMLITRVDSDGDGSLDLCEFIDLNTRAMSTSTSLDSQFSTENAEDDALLATFNRFDINKDGFISADELHRSLAAFGEDKFSLEECGSMIKCVDENGDHLISFAEFQSLMSDQPEMRGAALQSVLAAASPDRKSVV